MDAALVIQFWIIAITLTCTPGADWAYVISAGVRNRSIVPAIAGILLGYVAVVIVVALGAGALITQYPAALNILTIAGALYLLWLGISTIQAKVQPLSAAPTPADDSLTVRENVEFSQLNSDAWRQFAKGMGVSAINPKGILLLIALLPQFTISGGWHSSIQMLMLGAIHLFNSAVVYTSVGVVAQRLLRTRPQASIVVTRVAGVVMTGFGGALLVQHLVTML